MPAKRASSSACSFFSAGVGFGWLAFHFRVASEINNSTGGGADLFDNETVPPAVGGTRWPLGLEPARQRPWRVGSSDAMTSHWGKAHKEPSLQLQTVWFGDGLLVCGKAALRTHPYLSRRAVPRGIQLEFSPSDSFDVSRAISGADCGAVDISTSTAVDKVQELGLAVGGHLSE